MVLRSMVRITPWLILSAVLACEALIRDSYRGKSLGRLTEFHHGVSGEVFAVDARTLHIRNFNYDGEGPAAFFYVGSTKAPHGSGLRLRDERGSTTPLLRYVNKDITLTLPEGTTLHNIRWFSVWCDEFAVNFGDVRIAKGFDFPRPFKLGSLSGIHGVSSDPVVVVDAQTLLIPNFSYDGEAPDAKFWVGAGNRPTPQGIRIPDENGKEAPLRRYDRKTIVLTLPNDLTVFDIGHFGVWCEAFTVDFGHVLIPQGLNVPPSLKMIGVSPKSKLNCEVLWDDLAFEVRWAVAGDSIVLQLVARLDDGEYMAFGLSGDSTRSQMVGGDVTVAWVDKETLKGHAQDYYLDAKSQCSGGRGSCPDERIQENSNNIRLLNAALVNGYSIVTYQRPLKASDFLDHPIYTNTSQPIIWAIGPLNARREVSYHSLTNKGDIILNFGRPPTWNCPTPEAQKPPPPPPQQQQQQQQSHQVVQRKRVEHVNQIVDNKEQSSNRFDSTRHRPTQAPTPAPSNPKVKPWDIPAIQCNEPEDGVFYAQMGPTGGKHGYSAITGHVGWGISWYINGLLIPEINVVRGRTYTFIVEGGLDSDVPAKYHPFYITDDSVGGYAYKTPEERQNVQIFAGAVQNKQGEVRPTGLGRLCNWTPDPKQPTADEFSSFGAYQRTLRLECDQGEPGIVQWTVGKDTPDTVYYQCYSHRYLGWKINVHDSCELESGSEPVPSYLKPPGDAQIGESSLGFITPDASENVPTVVKAPEVYNGQPLSPAHVTVGSDLEGMPTVQQSNKVAPPTSNAISSSDVKITYVPQFQFVDEMTGEPLDSATIQKLQLDNQIKHLEAEFYSNQNFNQPSSYQQKHIGSFPGKEIGLFPEKLTGSFPGKEIGLFPEKLTGSFPGKEIGLFPEKLTGSFPGKEIGLFPEKQSNPVTEKAVSIIPSQTNQFISFFHPPQKLPLTYMVKEEENNNDQQPALPAVQFQADKTLQMPLFFDEKFNQEFLKNYHQLQAEAMANLNKHKQKFQQQFGKPRIQYSLPRRPPPHQMFSPQQRPLPPGMYRSKKPTTKVPYYPKPHPSYMNFPSFSKKPQFSTLKSPFKTTPLFPTETTLAVNTGFNPETIKVEGGFKPILSTGIAPKFKISERAGEAAEDDSLGTIDLTKELPNKLEEELDLFKNQKPEMFEPMFIPSPPDNNMLKLKKKHIKLRNEYLEHYNTEKGNNKYIKIRPRPSLLRHPLYPVDMIPPFKIPFKGKYPEFRNQKEDEGEQETSTDFDIIDMNNETSTDIGETDNIFDIIINNDNKTEKEEIAMADERRDVYQHPYSFALTHDGKTVSAIAPPPNPALKKFDISLIPQFKPFQGDLPPNQSSLDLTNLPQFKSSQASKDILPPSDFPDPPSIDSTKSRIKRSPDHVRGHVGDDHDEYDRQHHDHHHHEHEHEHKENSASVQLASIVLPVMSFAIARLYC